MPNIAVIGRGFSALSSAYLLAKNGFQVSLYGPESTPHTGSTAAHGVSTIKGLLESTDKLFWLKQLGHFNFLHWLQDIEKTSGIKVPKIMGVHEPFWNQEDFFKEQSRIYKKRFLGAFCQEEITYQDTPMSAAFYSNFYPKDFWIDSDVYLKALEVGSTKLGVRLESNEEVVSLEEDVENANVVLRTKDNQTFTANFAVGAVGTGVSEIKGLDSFRLNHDLKVAPGSTYKINTNLLYKDLVLVKNLTSLACFGQTSFLGSTTLNPQESLKFFKETGKTKVLRESTVDKTTDILQNILGSNQPSAAADFLWDERYGVRLRTRKRLPIASPLHPTSLIFMSTAYYKNGITLSPFGAMRSLFWLTQHASSKEASKEYFFLMNPVLRAEITTALCENANLWNG